MYLTDEIKMRSFSFATLIIVPFLCIPVITFDHSNESLVLGRIGESISLKFMNVQSKAKIIHKKIDDNYGTYVFCDLPEVQGCIFSINDTQRFLTLTISNTSSEDTGVYEMRYPNVDISSQTIQLILYDYKELFITILNQEIDLGSIEFIPNAPQSLDITVKVKQKQLCKNITLQKKEDSGNIHSGTIYAIICKYYEGMLSELNNGTSLTFAIKFQGESLTTYMRKVSNVTRESGNKNRGQGEEPKQDTKIIVVIIAVIVVVVAVIVIVIVCWCCKRRRCFRQLDSSGEDEGIELTCDANTVNGPENESETEPLANGNPESVHDENADTEENTNIKILQNEHKRETDLQNEKGDMNEDITTGIMQDLKEDLLSVNEDHIPINTKVENVSSNKNIPNEQRIEHQKKLAHREESNLRFNDKLLENAIVRKIHLSKTVQMIPYDDEERCSYKLKPNDETLTEEDRDFEDLNENLVARPDMVIDEQNFEPRGNREIHPEVEQIDRSSSDELNAEDEIVQLNAENDTSESVCEDETDQPNGKDRTCETTEKASTVEKKDEVENAVTKGKDRTADPNDEDETSKTNDEVNTDETRHTGCKYRDVVTGAIVPNDQAVKPTPQVDWKTQILPAYQQDYAFPQKITIGGNIQRRDKSLKSISFQQPTYSTGMRLFYYKPISRHKTAVPSMDIICV